MSEYQETGNQVPVTVDELKECVNLKLAEFDSQPDKAGLQNPYVNDIIYQTKNGKTIKVPKNIQLDVVNDWVEKKKQAGQEQAQEMQPDIPPVVSNGIPNGMPIQNMSDEDKMELIKQQYLDECGDEESSSGVFGSLFFKVLIFVIVAIAIYYFLNK